MQTQPHILKVACRKNNLSHQSAKAALFLAVLISVFSRTTAQTGTGKAATPGSTLSTEAIATTASEGPALGSISGHVIADDGQPLPQARVSIFQFGTAGRPSMAPVGADGGFRRDNLVPGLYEVRPYLAGYVTEIDDQSTDRQTYYRPGDVITLRMTKGSVITGKVTDVNGQPVVSVPVRVQLVGSLEGKLNANPQGVERFTNDRGIYRIYGLKEGVYRVSAGGPVGIGFGVNSFDRDVPIYYPSSTRNGASEVTLHTGDEMTNIDIRYRSERGHVLSGLVVAPGTPSSTYSSITLSLMAISDGSVQSNLYLPPNNSELNQPFEIQGVPDGEYLLNASLYSPVNLSSAFAKITVKGADVSGLILRLSAMASIEGRLIVQQTESAQCKDKVTVPQEFFVGAKVDRSSPEEQKGFSNFGHSGAGAPDPKGGFKVTNLYSGTYHLWLRFPSEQWFIKSVEIGPASGPLAGKNDKPVANVGVPMDGIVLASGEHKTGITITVAAGGGNIHGRIEPEIKDGAISNRILVTVIPADVEKQKDSLRFAETFMKPDHSFELKNLAPGNYFIVARTVSEAVFADPNRDPSYFSSKGRLELIPTATAAKTTLELKECQTTSDIVIHPSIASK